MDTIRHYASFPATGVSLRQMVQFGDRPSTGMLHAVFIVRPDRESLTDLLQALSSVRLNFSRRNFLSA